MRNTRKIWKILAIVPLLVPLAHGYCASDFGLPCQCNAPIAQPCHSHNLNIKTTTTTCEHCRAAEARACQSQGGPCRMKKSVEPEGLITGTGMRIAYTGLSGIAEVPPESIFVPTTICAAGLLLPEYPPGAQARLALISTLRI